MEGWVDLGYPEMHKPGIELAIFQSLVWRPTTTLLSQPKVTAGWHELMIPAAHYMAIDCPQQQTIRPAVQHADIWYHDPKQPH